MNRLIKWQVLVVAAGLSVAFNLCFAENIDPHNDDSRYAYGENIGWLNFDPNKGPGVTVGDTQLAGYIWAQNVGWINLSPASYGGVVNDGGGNLSGYAWGENVGWINFAPAQGGVTIDEAGNFNGWAWGRNIGWIHLRSESPVCYKVTACRVYFEDLANFADDWLKSGAVPGDLSGNTRVDLIDYNILASKWLTFCSGDWPLK